MKSLENDYKTFVHLTFSVSLNLTRTRNLPPPPPPPAILTSIKSESIPEMLSNTAFGFSVLNLNRMSCACVGVKSLVAIGDPGGTDLFVNSYTLASARSRYVASTDKTCGHYSLLHLVNIAMLQFNSPT